MSEPSLLTVMLYYLGKGDKILDPEIVTFSITFDINVFVVSKRNEYSQIPLRGKGRNTN